MSLSMLQKHNTKRELRANIELAGLSVSDIARDLDTTEDYVLRVLDLRSGCLEDPWIVKEYLCDVLSEQHKETIAFTALAGDYRQYWFLDASKIDARMLG